MGNSVHLAVAGGVYDGVFLCYPFFPRDVLDEILDLSHFLRVFLPTLLHGVFYTDYQLYWKEILFPIDMGEKGRL